MAGINKVILKDLYMQGNSLTEIEKITGIHRSTIRTRLHKFGVLRSKANGVRLAAKKGKLGGGMRGRSRIFTESHKKAISDSALSRWEGKSKGFSIKPNGYTEITTGQNKGRGMHRVIVEKVIGRKLKTSEAVHHIDGDRSNNENNNLILMTRSFHSWLHRKMEPNGKERNNLGQFI